MNKKLSLNDLQSICKSTLIDLLEIEYIEIGENYLIAKMPISQKTSRPGGFLHGGASLVLAESVGSMLSIITLEDEKKEIFALELSANYIKTKKEGYLLAKACFFHKGKKTHLIHVHIYDEAKKNIAHIKMTNIILTRKETS